MLIEDKQKQCNLQGASLLKTKTKTFPSTSRFYQNTIFQCKIFRYNFRLAFGEPFFLQLGVEGVIDNSPFAGRNKNLGTITCFVWFNFKNLLVYQTFFKARSQQMLHTNCTVICDRTLFIYSRIVVCICIAFSSHLCYYSFNCQNVNAYRKKGRNPLIL